jgi:uncharacterized protein
MIKGASMMLIPTYIAVSKIPYAGLGIFCSGFVAKGTALWEFTPGFDYEIHELPEHEVARTFVLKYGYVPLIGPRRWVMCVDDARFFNHSDDPTCVEIGDNTVARYDLHPGTELTTNYSSFARDPFASFA